MGDVPRRFQSLGRQLVDIEALESAPLFGPEPRDDPGYIALLVAARDFVYEILPQWFLRDLDRRGLLINAAVLAGDAKWPVEQLERTRWRALVHVGDDRDAREQRRRLLQAFRSLLFARPSLYFPHDMPGQVLRSNDPRPRVRHRARLDGRGQVA